MIEIETVINHFKDAIEALEKNNKWRLVRVDILESAIALLKGQEPVNPNNINRLESDANVQNIAKIVQMITESTPMPYEEVIAVLRAQAMDMLNTYAYFGCYPNCRNFRAKGCLLAKSYREAERMEVLNDSN